MSAHLLVVLTATLSVADAVAAQDPSRTQLPEGALRIISPDLVGGIVARVVSTPGSYGSWFLVVENRSPRDAAAFSVEVYRQGSLVVSKVFSGLPSNTQRSLGTLGCWMTQTMTTGVPCPWPVGYGCADSWIIVDVNNAVAESSESNNRYEFCWGTQTTFSPAQ